MRKRQKGRLGIMFNIHNNKTKRIISAIIIVILVIAMVVPTLAYLVN